MGKLVNRKSITTILVLLALVAAFISGNFVLRGLSTHASGGLAYQNLAAFVTHVQQTHKAPFDRDIVFAQRTGAALSSAKVRQSFTGAITPNAAGTNVKVNQDRNPWPKAELGAGIDPTNGQNYVVMANDFREDFDHEFYHVSTNGGTSWTDDSATAGNDPFTGFAPFSFQSDPGVAFDTLGHSVLSFISGGNIFDFNNSYINMDTEVTVVVGYAHGTYTDLLPTSVDDQPCIFTSTTSSCAAQLDKPLITVDNVAGSPNKGTIYVYYTLFCIGTGANQTGPCTDGGATVPAGGSAILESHAAAANLPFSTPALVSGTLSQEQFSDMVVDSHGTPHIFFDDFTTNTVNMYESTLSGGTWTVSTNPVASITYNGLGNGNWAFRSNGTVAPGCSIYIDTAYCAFAANQVGTSTLSSTPSIYVAAVNTLTAASTITKVNKDPLNNSKSHFFPWASTGPHGGVFVGWYDDLNDPFNTKVDYRVAKSNDGGATFPKQAAVNDVSFNPCVGFPGCGFFGDYTQLVTGPDAVTHAAWSDTRDGASMQIYTQALHW